MGIRDRGIGRRLKLFQREDALARGIGLVEWTFDPLITKNAYFNFMRLGAIARRYLPNAYGITTSPLHGSLPTDRLVAEWHLRLRSCASRSGGEASKSQPISKKAVRITIPSEFRGAEKQPTLRAPFELQADVRAQFSKWLALKDMPQRPSGPAKTGMDYILEPGSST